MQIRTQFPDLFLLDMLPALDELIMAKHDSYPEQYSKFFNMNTSRRERKSTTL